MLIQSNPIPFFFCQIFCLFRIWVKCHVTLHAHVRCRPSAKYSANFPFSGRLIQYSFCTVYIIIINRSNPYNCSVRIMRIIRLGKNSRILTNYFYKWYERTEQLTVIQSFQSVLCPSRSCWQIRPDRLDLWDMLLEYNQLSVIFDGLLFCISYCFRYHRQDLPEGQLCRYFVYSRADFGVFRPEGTTRCTDQGEIWQGADHRSAPPCQISSWSVQGWGFTAPKTEKNSNFTNIIAPKGRVPCTIFTKFTSFMRVLSLHNSAKHGCFISINDKIINNLLWWGVFRQIFNAP